MLDDADRVWVGSCDGDAVAEGDALSVGEKVGTRVRENDFRCERVGVKDRVASHVRLCVTFMLGVESTVSESVWVSVATTVADRVGGTESDTVEVMSSVSEND